MTELTRWSWVEALGSLRKPKNRLEIVKTREVFEKTIARSELFQLKKGVHQKQDWFWALRPRTKVFCSGNQAGKTIALLVELACCLLGCRPYDIENPPLVQGRDMLFVLAGPDYTNWAALNALPKLERLFPFEALLKNKQRNQGGAIDWLELWNGNQLKVMSYEQDDFKFESWTVDGVFWDEAMPQGKYFAASRGSMAKKAPHVMAYTPRKEAWTLDHFYEPAFHVSNKDDFEEAMRRQKTEKPYEIISIEATSYDNPYIDKAEIERFEQSLPEEERESRILGRYKALIGLIYKGFDWDTHVKELPFHTEQEWELFQRYPKYMVVDPHDRKPFACIWGYVNPLNHFHIFQEWPETEYWETTNQRMGVERYLELWRSIEGGDNYHERPFGNMLWFVMDPQYGKTPDARSEGHTLQYDFSEIGRDFDCTVSNDITSGHMAVRARLMEPARLFITPNCKNTILSFRRYNYDEYRQQQSTRHQKEVPREEYKDFMDCVRYLCKSEIQYVDRDQAMQIHQEVPSLGW